MMLAQLCKARPKALWDKLTLGLSAVGDENGSQPSVEEVSRCQLQQCTFCDYRVSCEVVSSSPEECLSPDEGLKVTENPAYGLSAKNWLEVRAETCKEETLCSPSKEHLSKAEVINTSSDLTTASQHDCDPSTEGIKMNHFNTFKGPKTDIPPNDKLKAENQKTQDSKNTGSMTWSVLKHRQTSDNCDTSNPVGMEVAASDKTHHASKSRWNKEKTLSLMKQAQKTDEKKNELRQLQGRGDLTRQKPVDRNSRNSLQHDNHSVKYKKTCGDPLSEIFPQVKTEESIQEWLARISETGMTISTEDLNKEKSNRGSAWDLRSDEEKDFKLKQIHKAGTDTQNKTHDHQVSEKHSTQKQQDMDQFYSEIIHEDEIDTTSVLCNATKSNPANIPMVVMQCSRLHSHIGSKPPFQQTSLPMGTLITALYQESEWLYIQTPHGVEGFISSSNCAPIGTINDAGTVTKKPWEPCDFPIQISRHKKEQFVCQQSAYIQAKLPMKGSKYSAPYVSTIRIKTNFYNDRFFSNTFKTKDAIKIAKTVTDILRSSPETKISQ